MDRASLYFMSKDDKNTFDFDETLPSLPLPELKDTMERYYACIQPFGTKEELATARSTIDEFQKGVGAELHERLKKRAASMRNWLGSWWEDYGYHLIRMPLLPYQLMVMPAQLEIVGVPETPEYMLKVSGQIVIKSLQIIYQELLHYINSNLSIENLSLLSEESM